MFFKKKESSETCNECGHVVALNRMSVVKVKVYIGYLDEPSILKVYYCEQHKKNYDLVSRFMGHSDKYSKEFQTDEYGCPFGYQPIKKVKTPHSSCRQGKRVRIVLRTGEVIITKFKDKKGGVIITDDGKFPMSNVKAFSIYKNQTV